MALTGPCYGLHALLPASPCLAWCDLHADPMRLVRFPSVPCCAPHADRRASPSRASPFPALYVRHVGPRQAWWRAWHACRARPERRAPTAYFVPHADRAASSSRAYVQHEDWIEWQGRAWHGRCDPWPGGVCASHPPLVRCCADVQRVGLPTARAVSYRGWQADWTVLPSRACCARHADRRSRVQACCVPRAALVPGPEGLRPGPEVPEKPRRCGS
jgi:hypothetical protein